MPLFLKIDKLIDMFGDFFAGNFMAHHVIFGEFMAGNFLARDFLTRIPFYQVNVYIKPTDHIVMTTR